MVIGQDQAGGKYWDVWGKGHGGHEDGDGGGASSSSPSYPFPPSPQARQGTGGRREAGHSCSRRGKGRSEGGPIRRMRVHAMRARASASVIGELSWKMRRFERGEGGGVT